MESQSKAMNLGEAQQKFIHDWGKLSTTWGANKAMGQIQALLLITKEELCADDIMERLCMSRGNVNMNLRALCDWGLVEKVHILGNRKDFFKAEKDLNRVFKIIIRERKKKELDPLLGLLEEVHSVKAQCPESDEFCRMTKGLHKFAQRAEYALNTISSAKSDWLTKFLIGQNFSER